MTLPPRPIRRLLLAPLVLVLSLALIALSPVLFVIAILIDLVVRGGWRSVRLVAFGVTYLFFEVVGLLAMFVLWVGSGFGVRIRSERMQNAHFAFMRWWLKGVNRAAIVCFHLRIFIEDRPKPTPGPILVFSRHAGPGNSMMLVGTLMVGYLRRPRIVMLAKLQWEPLCDIMFNRLPNRFIEHDPSKRERYIRAIADLATGLGDRDAYVLFPEGKDFTPRVRERAIAHLFTRGHHREAEQAEQMQRVLPPKSGGVMAAITAAPQADVVFVAHSVLEDVGSFRNVWSRIPFRGPIFSRYWRIPAAEVPREREVLNGWLYDWWARIDAWIADRVSSSAPGSEGGTTGSPGARQGAG